MLSACAGMDGFCDTLPFIGFIILTEKIDEKEKERKEKNFKQFFQKIFPKK